MKQPKIILSTWLTIASIIVSIIMVSSVAMYRLNQVEARVDSQQIQIDTVQCDISEIQQDTAVIKSTLVEIRNELIYQREHIK